MKKIAIIVGLLLTGSLYAQDYQYQSNVDKNDTSGFYKIDLNPTVLGKLQANSADLRLIDQAENEVPYYLEQENFSVEQRVFKEYKVISKMHWRNGATVLRVENTEQSTINNIQLQIKNFDVSKRLELAGSNDSKQWYTIKENYVFRTANGGKHTSEVKSLNFPYCDYKYYRIIIYDVFSLPINVLKVGYYDTHRELGQFEKVPTPQLSTLDTIGTKETFIKLNFNDRPYFDKLVFKINKPTYFYRNARLALKKTDHKGRIYYETVTYFVLNSNSELALYVSGFPHQEFYLIVANEDNPPLEIESIEAFQLKHYLITHLEANNEYRLVFGSEKHVSLPNYDIAFFKHKIAKNIVSLKLAPFTSLTKEAVVEPVKPTSLIWLAVAAVALLLGFISYKMINEMGKDK